VRDDARLPRMTEDDLEELYARARSPKKHRTAAAQLVALAEDEQPSDAEVSPAALLVSAGEHLSAAGDHEAAVELFRRATSSRGHVPPDVRCYLHHGLLEVGDLDGAHRIADELRREGSVDGDVYLVIGEDYELADDLREAHRWFTRGVLRSVTRVEDDDDDVSGDAAVLIIARSRVRRSLGLPLDEYDELVATARER
jgi:predicted Zn-dependent protease